MGGNLKSETSRELTPNEITYIENNPELHYLRVSQKQDQPTKNNGKKNSSIPRLPYSLEDLPPKKHKEAGYNETSDLFYVPLDIYPKRCIILRLGPEDVLFDPSKAKVKVRRSFNSNEKREEDARYTELLMNY